MRENKKINYILLIIFIILFFSGLATLIKSNETAESLVADTIKTIETEDPFVKVDNEAVGQSIELYAKELRKKGTFILIHSSVGIVVLVVDICKKSRKSKIH